MHTTPVNSPPSPACGLPGESPQGLSWPRLGGMLRLVCVLLCGPEAEAFAAAEGSADSKGSIVVERELRFESANQSLWGGDSSTWQMPLSVPVLTLQNPNAVAGGIVTRQVNNPLHAVWQAAYDTAYAAAYGAVYAANYPGCLISALGNTSQASACAGSIAGTRATNAARTAAGSEPARTLTEHNGGRVFGNGSISAGLTGLLGADGGSVRVDYTASVKTEIGNAGAQPGDRMTLKTSITAHSAQIHTTDINLSLAVGAYLDMRQQRTMEAYLANLGGLANLVNVSPGYQERPLMEVTAGNGVVTLDPLGLGDITVASSLTKQFGVKLSDPTSTVEVMAPVFEVTLGPPDTSTDPADTALVGDTDVWRNGVVPERRGSGEIGTIGNFRPLQGGEFARVALDMDVFSLMLGYPLGARAAINTPPLGFPTILAAEGNLLDFDLETFWSLKALYDFTPNLQVTYLFSEPVEITNAAGEHIFTHVITVGADEELTFVRPADGVSIETTFSLTGNEFSNLTDFELQFGLSASVLELVFSGVLFGIADGALNWAEVVDLPNRMALLMGEIAIGNPIRLGRVGDPQGVAFALRGFEELSGPSLQVAAIPEPSTWLMLMSGLALILAAAHGAHRAARGAAHRP
jgi:hypothetical protein